MTRYVALLRAVNVGGAGKLAMPDLLAAGATAGLTDRATVLRSGNLIGTSDDADATVMERRLAAALASGHGLATEVIVRSAAQWRQLVAANPLLEMAQDDPAHLVLVVFKAEAVSPRTDGLQAAAAGCERVILGPRAAYVAYPDGIGRSRLTLQLIERCLGVSATGRNWSTVRKIAGALGIA